MDDLGEGALPAELRGAYRAEGWLGSGAMGSVLRARDLKLDRPVAIKLLRRVDDADMVERFRREARCLSRVTHPHVLRLYDWGIGGSQPYLVTELLEGASLAGADLPGGPLPYLLPIAEALEAVHAAGLVHRDVKPDNVVRRGDGSPVLVDFGLVAAPGSTRLTRTGDLVGTVAYLAPEVLAGGNPTPAADFFAWGATLFVLLEGRTPFSPYALIEASEGRGYPEPSFQVRASESPEAELVRRCMDPDPRRRPASRADCEAVLAAPVPPRPVPSAAPRAAPGHAAGSLSSSSAGRRSGLASRVGSPPPAPMAPRVLAAVGLAGLLASGTWWASRPADPGAAPGSASAGAPSPPPATRDAPSAPVGALGSSQVALAPPGVDADPGPGPGSQEPEPRADSGNLAGNVFAWFGAEEGFGSLAFASDGSLVVPGPGRRARRLDLAVSAAAGPPFPHPDPVQCVAAAPGGAWVALGGWGGTITLHAGDRPAEVARRDVHRGTVYGLAFSGDGRTLYSVGHDGAVQASRIPDLEPQAEIGHHQAAAMYVAVAPGDRALVTAGFDDRLAGWGLAPAGVRFAVGPPEGSAMSPVFSGDGRVLLVGNRDGRVRRIEPGTGKVLAVLAMHEGNASSVALDRAGARAVSGGWDQKVRLLDLAAGTDREVADVGAWVRAVAFVPGDREVVALDRHGAVHVLPLGEGTQQRLPSDLGVDDE